MASWQHARLMTHVDGGALPWERRCHVQKHASGTWALSCMPGFMCLQLLLFVAVFGLFMQPGGVQQSMVPMATLSLVGYTVCIPLLFLTILVRHGAAIRHDQTLRAVNQGSSEASNPFYHIRQRYQELYRLGVWGVWGVWGV